MAEKVGTRCHLVGVECAAADGIEDAAEDFGALLFEGIGLIPSAHKELIGRRGRRMSALMILAGWADI
ncbi:MAG: hypothetical protein KGN36_14555 [Acidobacteriota bacterium]|nr:hypothetical protein [Acidobacteriota bacterium]